MIPRNILCICLLCSAWSQQAIAQEEPSAELLNRYKDENAVILKNEEHVVLRYEDNKLIARNFVEKEVLLLSDIAPNVYNNEHVYHSSFSKLLELAGSSLIPARKGYRTVKTTEFKTSSAAGESVFYDDVKQTVLTYSGLVKNAITKVNYILEYKDIHFLPSYYFQSYAPVVDGSFIVTAPKEVHLKYILRGDTSRIKTTVEESRNTRTYTFRARDMPTFKSYDDAPAVAYYMPHVLIYVEEYQSKKDDRPTPVLGTVDNLYRFYYPFISGLNKTHDSTLARTVAAITKGLSAPEDKARAIYHWVQQNIKYVAFEDGMEGFVPRPAGLVCSRKYGDCKDMSSLLVAMCREAGLDAHFTWIGTRHIPYTYEEAPLPSTDNHMICALNIDNRWVFMDGTDPAIRYGVPPYAIQGKEALIGIDSGRYEIIRIPEIAASNNLVDDSTTLKLLPEKVAGSVDISLLGYAAWRTGAQMMYQNEKEKDDAIRSMTSRGSNKYIQRGFATNISQDDEKKLTLHSEFEIGDYARQVGKEWYINLNLLRTFESSWIDIKDRNVPVENDFKSRTRQVVVLEIPKGYHVSYLPPPQKRSVKDLWSYDISYAAKGNTVELVKEYEMNALYIKPEQFAAHNGLVSDLKNIYKESVVLAAD